MESVEENPEVSVKVETSNENTTDESQDISSHQDEIDSYPPPDSIKSEETEDEEVDGEEVDGEDGELLDDPELPDDDEDDYEELDDMEGTVIHFLAEKSISKTKVKSGIKSACRFKCDNCTSIFRYKSTLNYHLKSECGRKVIKGKALVEKQPQGKVSCNICAKTLCSRTSLMVHMRIHTGERPFVCSECGRSFFQKAHLVDHQNKMHTATCVLCRLCNATFEDKYHLLLHMKQHKQAVAPFNCKFCEESFSTRASLTNHVAGRHSAEAKAPPTTPAKTRTRETIDPDQTVCYECGRSYSGPRQLRAHVRRAHRASLQCPHCPRLFPSGYDLRVHTRCHTGERPYSCEFCDRTFSRKSILDVHRTLHTGQKDFVCSICSKAFNRKSKLQVHFTEHTRQTVKCEICQKEFKCQSYLSSHMKIHNEEQTSKQQKRKRAVPPLKPIKFLKLQKQQKGKNKTKKTPPETDQAKTSSTYDEQSSSDDESPTLVKSEVSSDNANESLQDESNANDQSSEVNDQSSEVNDQSSEVEDQPEFKPMLPKDEIYIDELPLDCSLKIH